MPFYSAPAFEYLDPVLKPDKEVSEGEKLDLASGWQWSVKALVDDGIYTAIIPRNKSQFYFFEMNKTKSPIFSIYESNTNEEISFAVWALNQGGRETFSQILEKWIPKNPISE